MQKYHGEFPIVDTQHREGYSMLLTLSENREFPNLLQFLSHMIVRMK